MAQYREEWFQRLHFAMGCCFFLGVIRKVPRCFSGLLDIATQFPSKFEAFILQDIGLRHREHQYIFLHGIVWAGSNSYSFRAIRRIMRQSNINNYMVQCTGTNRSSLVVHHNTVGIITYGRCLTLFEGVDSVFMTYGA